MGKTISFYVDGLLVGKEVNKATEAWERNGKTFKARPASYSVFVLLGDKAPNSELFELKPEVAIAKVTYDSYLALKEPKLSRCRVRQGYDHYDIISIDGMTMDDERTDGLQEVSESDSSSLDVDFSENFGLPINTTKKGVKNNG